MSAYDKLEAASRQYEEVCVLTGAAEVDLFTPLTRQPLTANELTAQCQTDLRATITVLNALTALGYLNRIDCGTDDPRYEVAEGFKELLDINSHKNSFIPMLRHRMNCLRNWSQLSTTLKTGKPAERIASMLGAEEDFRSFVLAMNSIGISFVEQLADEMQKAGLLNFKCMLDVGGASGTYTLTFLKRNPKAQAILFDRPAAVQEAEKRFARSEFSGKVRFISGDFETDTLPGGADFAWVSAIIHQFDNAKSQALYKNVYQALESGGTIAVRDFVMDSTHTKPAAGTLFAINMLIGTAAGKCYDFDEIRCDLEAAGFRDVRFAIPAGTMSAVVTAKK
ncbi:MAG: methyltransferase domain-containing protein [Planctomycetaceae bacterium]|nr:methyltransferase domain-containing protein [Planctomycetaceae bacterium]